MRSRLLLASAAAVSALVLAGPAADRSDAAAAVTEAAARLVAQGGKPAGTVLFTQTPKGVRIEISAQGLTPGPHAVHIHKVGKCDSERFFNDAGDHFDVGGHRHGRLDPKGPHTGDMENVVANKFGFVRATVTVTSFTLGPGPTSLFDADGSAFVIHEKPDDFKTQPAGGSGERMICGIIKPL
jgi:Cu-Zn family superoxide dismutase